MTYVIDTPHDGNCGFSALAIGLINIIKEEFQQSGTSDTYNRWVNAGLDTVSLEQIINIDLEKLYNSPCMYEEELFKTLQMSLRTLTVNLYIQDLYQRIQEEWQSDSKTLVEGSFIYIRFMELVQYYLNKGPKTNEKPTTLKEIAEFNGLALYPELLELAKRTAEALQPQIENRAPAEIEVLENAFVKQVLVQDFLSHNKINPNSLILKGINNVREPGRWATHDDLKVAAGALNVNLYVTNKNNGPLLPHWRTVNLNIQHNGEDYNHHNGHWTTNVEQLIKTQYLKSVAKPEQTLSSSATIVKQLSEPKPIDNKIKSAPLAETAHRDLSSKINRLFSKEEELVINATVSTQVEKTKADAYKEHVKQLIAVSSELFKHVKRNIDPDEKNAPVDEFGIPESDELFATHLQAAEFRKVKLR